MQKYVTLNLKGVTSKKYTKAIETAEEECREGKRSVWFDNSYTHVAKVLNMISYNGHHHHNWLSVWWMVLTQS